MAEWLDIATMAIPRLVTEECIGSLIEHMGVGGRKLRWVVHLDQYEGMEHLHSENLEMIERVAGRFDDAVVLSSNTRLGFGRSFKRVIDEIRHDMFNVEDDWKWCKDFEMDDVYQQSRDGFHMARPYVRTGSMQPALWKLRIVEALRDNYPQPIDRATEVKFKRLLYQEWKFKNQQAMGPVPRFTHFDIGRRKMAKMGFEENHVGLDISHLKRGEIDCVHLGEKVADRQVGNGGPWHTVEVYKCHHARRDETTDGICRRAIVTGKQMS